MVEYIVRRNVKQGGPIAFHCDSTSAINIVINPLYYERTQHVGVDCYFIREKIEEKDVKLAYTSVMIRLQYFLTEGVTRRQLSDVLSKLDIENIYII